MATGTQPDAGQILNSLINSILLIDDNLAIHYANPAAQQLLAQSSRKLFGHRRALAYPFCDGSAYAGRHDPAGDGTDG